MPPTRSMPPAKAVKTERTHEENQERAYIAASRRSDRSLEARVESARRASEIHKRRTGRSLRVTEQDVQNEEMYEEEDDDLPFQYRRLTAHLQTGSDEFNRRLSAYLVNHVAMRSALEQSIHQSYAQEFPGAPQYNHSMFPSPLLAHQQQQQSMQSPRSPTYRQQPYPSPAMQQGFSLNPHQRSASIPQPSSDQNSPAITSEHNRSASISGTPTTAGYSSTSSNQNQAPQPTRKPSFPPGTFAKDQFTNPMSNPAQFFSSLPSYDMGAFTSTQMPSFSTQLPAETQGFLNGTLDPNDPLTSMMMAGNNYGGITYNFEQQNSIPYRSTNNTIEVTKQNQHQTLPAGLNSTLAPAETSKVQKQTTDEETPGDVDNLNENFFDNAMLNQSGTGTPSLEGENWDSWINDGQWDIPTASQ